MGTVRRGGEGVVVSPLVVAVRRQGAVVPEWLGAAVRVLLGLEAVMCLVRLGFDVLEGELWAQAAAGRVSDTDPGVRRMLASWSTGTADNALFFLTAAVFIAWLYRAHRAAQSIAPGRLTNSPGWTIASWFVPLGSLWMPYQSVRDIWQASGPTDDKRPRLVLAWWLLFTVARWSGLLTGGLATALRTDPGAEVGLYVFFGVRSVMEATAAVLAVVMVRRLMKRQGQAEQVLDDEWAVPA
ncbi:DUF4328 domain-containing protein [Actinacidiphila acididurans]|uniref:DUF4328 domain-containing protein n=1 Tax=Actinacidiphila acididurans TaxID=2784346 RepID=A0ABS2U170_9ACTN|nr:DUF4328 domain-containing protein [Actinacidiphila acididurans]MBM9509349.1 DUF4328 domain-containing protein [Actinacidiphila acididurans]